MPVSEDGERNRKKKKKEETVFPRIFVRLFDDKGSTLTRNSPIDHIDRFERFVHSLFSFSTTVRTTISHLPALSFVLDDAIRWYYLKTRISISIGHAEQRSLFIRNVVEKDDVYPFRHVLEIFPNENRVPTTLHPHPHPTHITPKNSPFLISFSQPPSPFRDSVFRYSQHLKSIRPLLVRTILLKFERIISLKNHSFNKKKKKEKKYISILNTHFIPYIDIIEVVIGYIWFIKKKKIKIKKITNK